MNNNEMRIIRGDIFYVTQGEKEGIGSEQKGTRPAVVISNDTGNKFAEVVTVAFISTKISKNLPTHIKISAEEYGLHYDSVILTEQVRTVSKRRLGNYVGHLDGKGINKLNIATLISMGMGNLAEEIAV